MAKKATDKPKADTKPAKSRAQTTAAGGKSSSAPVGQKPAAPKSKLTRFQSFVAARVPRKAIRLADYNPRMIDKHAKRKLKKSLEDHGMVETLVWNKRTGNLVGGHQRISQLDELEGNTDYELDVSVIDVPLEQEQAINIALNNPLLSGQYDMDAFEQIISQEGFPVQSTGFDRASLLTMMDQGVLEGIFGPEASKQAEAERPVIDELTEIKESGKEADAAAQAESDRDAKRAAEVERMKQGRKDYIARQEDSNASEFMVVFVGNTEHEADELLIALDWPSDNRYVPIHVILDKLKELKS